MSAIAERTYKDFCVDNKDWFQDTQKNDIARPKFLDAGDLKKENTWVLSANSFDQLTNPYLLPRVIKRDHSIKTCVIKTKAVVRQQETDGRIHELLSKLGSSGRLSRGIKRNHYIAEAIKTKPVLQQQEAGIQFAELASEWKDSVRIISDWNLMVLHPSYQRIIGLGPDVIPFILKELEQNGGHWFWALQALTGDNPVADEDAGRTRKMAEAWLSWGREKGYI